jgi:hypothetical protein
MKPFILVKTVNEITMTILADCHVSSPFKFCANSTKKGKKLNKFGETKSLSALQEKKKIKVN